MDWRRAFEASLSLLCSDSLQPPAQPAVIAETGEVSALTAGPAGGCVPGGTQPPAQPVAFQAEHNPPPKGFRGWGLGCFFFLPLAYLWWIARGVSVQPHRRFGGWLDTQ